MRHGIKERQVFAPNYPMIADVDYNVSKLYGMLPAPVSGDPTKHTAADNQTVRNVFVISLQLTARHRLAGTPPLPVI
jgi:alkyl hydroperoxide reductase subunit AhpC